jgi:hypothetical protein
MEFVFEIDLDIYVEPLALFIICRKRKFLAAASSIWKVGSSTIA